MLATAIGTFSGPATVVFGRGARRTVGEHAERLGAQRALVVTDSYFAERELANETIAALDGHGVDATLFSDVQPDPQDVAVLRGFESLRASGAEVVIALGGGSVIDAAKMIAVLSSNPPPISQYMGYGRLPRAGLPVIAIPTTAGTGSEATRVTVITDTDADTKMMILDDKLLPAVAIIDAELSATMPAELTASVGVDTLTHGIEAFVSRLANPVADLFALACVGLVAHNLERAWSEPGDEDARSAMALAAFAGGSAFSNSSVCLVHGLSRPLGAVFHVPHGVSNAVLLPTVTRYSIPGAVGRYARLAREAGVAPAQAGNDEAAASLVAWVERLNSRLEVPRLRDLPDVEREAFERSLPKMAEDALASGSPDRNPIVPDAADIVALYREAW